MESEATPTVEANFRPPETRGNFSVETPADSGVMELGSPEYNEYKIQVEATDQARLAKVRAHIEWFRYFYGFKHGDNVAKPFNNFEVVNNNGKDVFVDYVPKEVLGSAFGMAHGLGNGDYAQVREDLSPRVKRFVKAHELYHLQDTKGGGWLRQEIRANFYPALKDPIGLLSTVFATLASKERRGLYLDRFKKSY
jgi:hypothetical protein